jgi:predicted small secreted protein
MRPAGRNRTVRRMDQPRFHPFRRLNMKFLKQLFALMVILSALTSLTACNTMHGAGKDIERGGEKLKDAAD